MQLEHKFILKKKTIAHISLISTSYSSLRTAAFYVSLQVLQMWPCIQTSHQSRRSFEQMWIEHLHLNNSSAFDWQILKKIVIVMFQIIFSLSGESIINPWFIRVKIYVLPSSFFSKSVSKILLCYRMYLNKLFKFK